MKIVDKRTSPIMTFEEWCDSQDLHVELTNSTRTQGYTCATLVSNDPKLEVVIVTYDYTAECCGIGSTDKEAINSLIESLHNKVLRREIKDRLLFRSTGDAFRVPEFRQS